MAGKSRILVIGGTGYIGKYIVAAAVEAGHPTFVLIRESSLSNVSKSSIIQSFKNSGVTLIYGDMYDHDSLVKAMKQVDVVISTVGIAQFADQVKIIAAIKEAGNNIKRFLPSEFGNDVDRVHSVEPATTEYAAKIKVRRAIEAEKIPYTYVCSHCFDGYFLPTFVQPGATVPPRDKVVIIGDGNVKAIFNKEEDVATYTIKSMDDPRTLNKTLFIKPPGNVLSFNELVSLWENKIGKKLERTYIPGDQVLKDIKESSYPTNLRLSKFHCLFVNGDQTNFEIEPSFGAEASELYPNVKYTTVDEYLNKFV